MAASGPSSCSLIRALLPQWPSSSAASCNPWGCDSLVESRSPSATMMGCTMPCMAAHEHPLLLHHSAFCCTVLGKENVAHCAVMRAHFLQHAEKSGPPAHTPPPPSPPGFVAEKEFGFQSEHIVNAIVTRFKVVYHFSRGYVQQQRPVSVLTFVGNSTSALLTARAVESLLCLA